MYLPANAGYRLVTARGQWVQADGAMRGVTEARFKGDVVAGSRSRAVI